MDKNVAETIHAEYQRDRENDPFNADCEAVQIDVADVRLQVLEHADAARREADEVVKIGEQSRLEYEAEQLHHSPRRWE